MVFLLGLGVVCVLVEDAFILGGLEVAVLLLKLFLFKGESLALVVEVARRSARLLVLVAHSVTPFIGESLTHLPLFKHILIVPQSWHISPLL